MEDARQQHVYPCFNPRRAPGSAPPSGCRCEGCAAARRDPHVAAEDERFEARQRNMTVAEYRAHRLQSRNERIGLQWPERIGLMRERRRLPRIVATEDEGELVGDINWENGTITFTGIGGSGYVWRVRDRGFPFSKWRELLDLVIQNVTDERPLLLVIRAMTVAFENRPQSWSPDSWATMNALTRAARGL